MQTIVPVTNAQLLQKGQQPLLKFEIFYGCCWVDLTDLGGKNYIKDISISTAGAEMTPDPVAGSWSAVVNNKNGMFDPDVDDYAPYNEFFRAGRKVKIQIGARYNGIDYYWRRIYGFMEIPDFSIDNNEVTIKGFDNMQFLTDTKLKLPDNYWGTLAIFNSVSSEGSLGAEIYDEKDAMDIDDEANNVASWGVTNCTFASQADAGGGSTWVGKMIVTGEDPDPIAKDIDVGTAVAGKEYLVTFKYKREVGGGDTSFEIWQTVSGDLRQCGGLEALNSDVYVEVSFYFTALASGPIQIWLRGQILNAEFRFDQFSIKEHISPVWYRYELPPACNGVYYATLDGKPVWPGKQNGEGWWYDADNRYFYFDEDKRVDDGTNNLVIYYFTDQIPEEVVADLLVRVGLYSNQAEALAAMIYTATSIIIEQVWFKKGKSAENAVKKLCERCNYRFYFNYSGRPVFKPTPTPKAAGSEDFTFTESEIANIQDKEDIREIRNRIVIEGKKEAQPIGIEESMPSELKGEASEVASINKYGEHTMSIKNHLFQDQATIDAYCATYLAAFKDPKWYTKFETPFNPAPLIKGDTLAWIKKYEASGTAINQRGLIRDVNINNFKVSYKLEKVI